MTGIAIPLKVRGMDSPFPHFPDDNADGAAPDAHAAGGRAVDAAALTPRLVTRGESLETDPNGGERWDLRIRGNSLHAVAIPLPRADANPSAAITDFLNFTFPYSASHSGIPDFLQRLSQRTGACLGGLTDRERGLNGYRHSFAFDHGVAMFAFGGQKGTALLSLPGQACALIPDWSEVVALLTELKARITRWDGAVDDYAGEHSVDHAVSVYLGGGFNAGGNKPSCSVAGNWIDHDRKGRTFYVGKSENGKLMRIYEKGKQLGDPLSPWVRWELELHNKDREIPFDVLLSPGKYVAGAYPCMAWVQEDASRIRTTQKAGSISYAHLCHYASVAYGSLLNIMEKVEGSREAAFERLVRGGVPSRLELAGLDLTTLKQAESSE